MNKKRWRTISTYIEYFISGLYRIVKRARNNNSMRYMHESCIGGTQSNFDRRNRRKTSLKMRRNYYNSTHDRNHSSDDDGDDAEKLRQQKILRGLTEVAKRPRCSRYDAIEYVKKLGTLQTFLLWRTIIQVPTTAPPKLSTSHTWRIVEVKDLEDYESRVSLSERNVMMKAIHYGALYCSYWTWYPDQLETLLKSHIYIYDTLRRLFTVCR